MANSLLTFVAPDAQVLSVYSITRYRRGLRAAVRGLYQGLFDVDTFWNTMQTTIQAGLRRAWQRGAAEFGVSMNELSQEEQRTLQSAILYEFQWIQGLAEAVEESRVPNRPKEPPSAIFSRLEPWIRRYEGVRSKARAMAGGDQKLLWDRGATKDGCRSCIALDGKVKRASWWLRNNIFPRVHGAEYLRCKGFN